MKSVEQLCRDIGIGTAASQEDNKAAEAQLYAADMIAQGLFAISKSIDDYVAMEEKHRR